MVPGTTSTAIRCIIREVSVWATDGKAMNVIIDISRRYKYFVDNVSIKSKCHLFTYNVKKHAKIIFF